MNRPKVINKLRSIVELYENKFRVKYPNAYRVYNVLKTGLFNNNKKSHNQY